ncbi:MAG: hypothetical protein QOG00_2330 [Pyrinomonadaceae bacterium]|jgi:uncharacterized repeat protein (TIGR01451 family)|nr:hypothetical protein [Pyrinomonadaceae bacterium]MDQ1593350.1 hypothetical protein [Pyrinomonadaceae bacterium]MDQ1612399.1 hypothetical protein [Pyrinomonadaceae bacterium]
MKTAKKKMTVPVVAALCLLLVGTAAAFAQKQIAAARKSAGAPEVKVKLAGSLKRNDESLALEKVSAVHPGEILDWTITSANEGNAPARQYKTIGQIPQGTSYVAGSAVAEYGAAVSYSIDGGKNFDAQPTVEEKQADGTMKRVPAPSSMYTQVRYEWSDPLAAGSTLSASYKVRVK